LARGKKLAERNDHVSRIKNDPLAAIESEFKLLFVGHEAIRASNAQFVLSRRLRKCDAGRQKRNNEGQTRSKKHPG
jgi:hypothetical protein